MIPLLIDEGALQSLLSALDRVARNRGHSGRDDIWFEKGDEIPMANKRPHPLFEELPKLYRALKNMKRQRATLASLRKSLEIRIWHLQATCNRLTLQRGIQQLPAEILSRIFELAYQSMGEFGSGLSVKISQVSRLFRTVVLNTPRLWSTVKTLRPLDGTQTFLSRSKNFPLSIILSFPVTNQRISDFFRLVVPHTSRWSSLRISARDANYAGALFEYSQLHLPRLTRITHELRLPEMGQNHALPYQLWSMPSLTRYETLNIVQRPGAIGKNLTQCRLGWKEWSSEGDTVTVRLSALLQNLRDLPLLQNLSLELENADVLPLEHLSTPVYFPSMIFFSLKIGWGTNMQAIHQLVRIMSLSRLRTLEVTLEDEQISACWTDVMFGSPGDRTNFPALETLSFTSSNDILDDEYFVDIVLSRCPSLLHFYVDAPKALLLDLHSAEQGSNKTIWLDPLQLRTLQFRHCDRLTNRDIESLGDKLRLGQGWDTFERLEIISCKGLSEQFLISFEDEMDGKLQWIV